MPSGNWLTICPRIPRIFLPAGTLYVPPIDRLPTELLCLIFILSAHDPYERPYLNRTFVPFKLTHVCKLWRDIAVDMPLLWQQFELRPCVKKGNHRELAKICAERASGLGLVVAYHELSVDEYDGSWFNDHTGLPATSISATARWTSSSSISTRLNIWTSLSARILFSDLLTRWTVLSPNWKD